MKRFAIAFLLCASAWAQLPVPGGASGGGGGGAGGASGSYSAASAALSGTNYFPPGGSLAANATEANVQGLVTVAGTIQNFSVRLSAAPGAGTSLAFTWRKNAADQSVTCTVANTGTSCSDTTDNFQVAANDLIDIKVVASGVPAASAITMLWSTPGQQGPQGATGNTGSTGATGPGYTATSTTSLAVGTGSQSFTTQSGLAYTAGARARASSAANTANYMEGLVTSYAGTSLAINVDTVGGSGTHADWNINVAGNVGQTGAQGNTGSQGPTGPAGTGNNGYCADASGSTTTYTCPTPTPTINSLSGLSVTFVPQTTNTGASTLNVASLGAKNLLASDGVTTMTSGALVGGKAYSFTYNGTAFVQTSSSGGSSTYNTIPTVVSTGTSGVVGSGTTITITAPTSISNGNALIAAVGVQGKTSETYTPPAGFTQIGSTLTSVANGKTILAIFCKTAASESGNYSFTVNNTVTGGFAIGLMLNIANASCTPDGTPTTATGNVTHISLGAITTTNANDLLLAIGAQLPNNNGTINVSTPGGMVSAAAASGLFLFTGSNGLGATPAVTMAASLSNNAVTNDFVGMAIALAPTATNTTVAPNNTGAATLDSLHVNNGLTVTGASLLTGGASVPTSTAFGSFQTAGNAIALIWTNGVNIQIDPSEIANYVTIGSGIRSSGTSQQLNACGCLWIVSHDNSQDEPIIRADSSDNITIGNDNLAAGSEEGDLKFAVQTGKTQHWSINAVDQMTLDANGLHMSVGPIQLKVVATASLPTCAAGNEGEEMGVNDANSTTFNAAVAGGGSNHVIAYCNGSGWTIH